MARELSIRQMWDDLAFPQLMQSFHLALGPTKIILAFFMVSLIALFGICLDALTRSVVIHPQADSPFFRVNGQVELSYPDELTAYISNADHAVEFINAYRESDKRKGVFFTLWNFIASRFNNATTRLLKLGTSNVFANLWNVFANIWLCFRALAWAVQYHPLYSLFFFSFTVLVVCFFGGGICRCAALEFARNEKPGLTEAIQYSREQFKNLLSAPLLPTGILTVFASIIILIGWAGNCPWMGELLIAVAFLPLLLLGLIMALLIFASLSGATLLFPAVVYERTTGLDAIGRSFSYVLNQPLWMVFYTLVEITLGTLFYLFIRLLVFVILSITYTLLSWGLFPAEDGIGKLQRIWSKPSFFYFINHSANPSAWSEIFAANLIYGIMLLLVAFVLALIVSFMFSSMTIIYSLMRKKVDKVDFDQVDIHLQNVADSSHPA